MNVKKTCGHYLLIKPLPIKEDKTDGGVVLAATTNADLAVGKIVAVPDTLTDVYSEGQTVLYFERRAIGVIHDKMPHLFINGGGGNIDGDVIAILDNTDKVDRF